MEKIDTIFLDMDGVCSNFDLAASSAHGLSPDPATRNKWEWYEDSGLTVEEFWEPINAGGAEFWRNLEEYPWFRRLYRKCKEITDNVYFCTVPSFRPDSLTGKVQWLQDRFGSRFTNYILCWNKGLLGREGSLLIDDKPGNIQKFWAAGGAGILWPQPWNARTCSAQTWPLPEDLYRIRYGV